ncbi:MAG TPA: FAD-dependent oxidoreductase, partial [Nocardioidaceae bacterium]|nr:FAD-dependent oxidoreductase [Nocardioidaceae bacterium]
MVFAITQNCCSDATCVSVCPVNAIHPTPEERAFGSTEMLHVDPRSCIDCGACADACPIDAIVPVESLFGPEKVYADINAAYYEGTEPAEDTGPNFHEWSEPTFDRIVPSAFKGLDVAVVGTGPAGMYAVEDLLLHTASRVTLVDRLSTPGGLVKWGVAPDHPSTKKVGHTFARFYDHPRLKLLLGTEIGVDLTHEDLMKRHDAVIYAVGAPSDRKLGVPGEERAHAATRFVAWYNGHPDVPADAFSLDTERVVVIGMGNVALDVARILLSDPESLSTTSIAPHALAELRRSRVREVVLVGRSSEGNAAYTRNEMLGLRATSGIEIVEDGMLSDAPGRRVVLRYATVP